MAVDGEKLKTERSCRERLDSRQRLNREGLDSRQREAGFRLDQDRKLDSKLTERGWIQTERGWIKTERGWIKDRERLDQDRERLDQRQREAGLKTFSLQLT